MTKQLHGWQITRKSLKQLDFSLQNFIKEIIGQAISFVNWVVSKIIIDVKVVTVVTIKLLYHAKFSQMKKHRKTVEIIIPTMLVEYENKSLLTAK